ncbi:MAG: tetratricopeptide repeat protein, partial [Abditibacteriota bacterium]|nr:tetratricopeptide repeat protein [Abditibacteriota bacterium]
MFPDTDELLEKARSLYSNGCPNSAIRCLNMFLRLEGDDPEAYFLRGCCHTLVSDPEAALEDFDKCILLDGSNTEAYLEKGNTLQYLGDKEGAIEQYEKAQAL